MSSNNPQEKKPVVTEVPHDDPWRSGRARFGLQRFRMGRDKKWHFAGQQPDETVRMVVRKHWWFLVRNALPLLGSFVLFLLVIWGSLRLPNSFIPWTILEIVAIVLMLVAGGWFVWSDLIEWYVETYIITDKRIISSRGLLEPIRQSTPLQNVRQIGIDIDTIFGFLLRYGTVHVYLVGGDLVIEDVPDPKKVKDAIDGITVEVKAKQPPKEKPPEPESPAMAVVLKSLAEGKEPPQLEDADAKYGAPHPYARLGPRRTFGGLLRIPADVHYSSGEYTVKYVQRSRYVLYRQLLIPIVLLLIVLPLSVVEPSVGTVPGSILTLWWFIASMVVLILLLSMGVIYTNYVDDVFILTNKRIVDIERRFIFFFEMREETEYRNIKDIKVRVPNVLQRLLDIGDIFVETPGANPDITLRTIDHPFYLQDEIYRVKDNKERAEAVKKENESKTELQMWFGKVLQTLEQTSQFKGAPNLQKMDLLEAMEIASELGFKVVVYDEDPSHPDIPPGRIIHQSPPPGTVIEPGAEIQVVLSRRATPADTM